MNQRTSESDDDDDDEELAIEPVCSKCGGMRLMHRRETNAANRVFYSCGFCGGFSWCTHTKRENLPTRQLCNCSMPSAPIVTSDGRHLWACSKPNIHMNSPCDFEEQIADTWAGRHQQIMESASKQSPAVATSGDEQFLVGASTLQLLQRLMNVSYKDRHEISRGFDM